MNGAGSATGRRSPATARSTTRCASSASGARCAPTPPRAASGSSGTCRSTSRPAAATTRAPRAVPPPRRGRRRSAAGRPQRARAALGQPALRLGRDGRAPATAGGSTGCAACSSSSTSSGSTTFAASPRYWTVPANAESARDGWWSPGPGAALFRAAEAELGPLPVIAEDLGVITPDVHALRDELGFPGMAVLLWAFGAAPDNPHRLENHRENQVVYTSTHDTDTLAGSNGRERRVAARRARAVVRVRTRDRAGPGHPRARQRGTDEPPRRDRRQLDVAPRARRADSGACRRLQALAAESGRA